MISNTNAVSGQAAMREPGGSTTPPALDEAQIRKLVDHCSDAILLLDVNGTVRYASPAITRLTGFPVADVLGCRPPRFVHPDDLARCLDAVSRHPCGSATVHRIELRLRHRNGSWVAVEADGVNCLNDPALSAFVVTLRDITQRRLLESALHRSEEDLRRSEAQYRALIEEAADAILVVDSSGRIIEANPTACALTGYPRPELLSLGILDTYPPEERVAAAAQMAALPVGERIVKQRRLRRRNGSDAMVEISARRLADGRAQGIIRDISQRLRDEDRLRWLTAATEQSPAAVIMTNTDGKIEYVNPGFTAMTGYAPDEVIGQTPRVLKSGLTRLETYQDLWSTVKQGRTWRGELCNRTKHGRLYWHSASVAPIRDTDGRVRHFMAVQQDITARIEAETALRERENRLTRVIDSNIVGMGYWNASGTTADANDEFLRIVGQTRDDLVAGRVTFRAATPPEFSGATDRALAEVAAGRPVAPWEMELVRPDGRRVPVVVGIAPLNDRCDQGVMFLLDITDRRALEVQFRQAQKMEAIGRLAGGVAHDFNNILTAIRGYSELLQQDLHPGHPAFDDATEIRNAADRAAVLTRQLLAFSRKQVMEPCVLDPNGLVRNIEKLLRRLLGDDVTLTTRLSPELGVVRADPGQLEQVLVNLVVNARDAMGKSGTVTVETGNVDVDAAFAASRAGLRPGSYVTLSVCDTGDGMDAQTRARVFEPFFTTKGPGKGTGLGLATVYGIVKQSDGYIDVASQPGEGATFTVYLPRASGPVESAAPGSSVEPVRHGSATILIADDDVGVRRVVAETLMRFGYGVLEAKDGGEALRIAAEHPGEIGLVVADLIMPGIGGVELADRLRGVRPGLRIILMSGYPDEDVARHGVIAKGGNYLKKPFTSETLLRRVQAGLEAQS